MPVLDAGSGLDHVTFVHKLNRLAAFLIVATAFRDEEDLSARVNVPVELRAGTVDSLRNGRVEGGITHTEFAKPDVTRVVFRGGQLTFRESRFILLGKGQDRKGES